MVLKSFDRSRRMLRKENENLNKCPNEKCNEPRYKSDSSKVPRKSLALRLDSWIRRYGGCMINGYTFHTKDRENERKTQNSGVVFKGEHGNNTIDFYGILIDILEVEYFIDKESKITSINVSRKWYSDQPYVLAQQVFYVEDIKLGKKWYVVEKANPHNSYDILQAKHQELVEEMASPGNGGQSLKKSKIDSLSSQSIKATAHERSTLDSEQIITPDSFRSRHFRRFNLVDEDMPLVNNEESANPGALEQRAEGIEVSPIDLYQYAHFSRKTGTWGSEKAKKTLEAMREMEKTTSITPREICIMKVGNILGYKGYVSTSKQIEYDVQRYKQRADEAEKKACEAEKKACDAEKKSNELAKKADEAEKRSSQMNDEIILLREKQALLEYHLESMMDMFTQLAAQPEFRVHMKIIYVRYFLSVDSPHEQPTGCSIAFFYNNKSSQDSYAALRSCLKTCGNWAITNGITDIAMILAVYVVHISV
ncbi:protein of unknown function DUF4216 [Dillenia turbinata]|uniref:DUF4216 domain-containing protein n=1 Tax=Dillenia turbinata TaxID=194707 RepID=A0AAN8VHL8_9MAGN